MYALGSKSDFTLNLVVRRWCRSLRATHAAGILRHVFEAAVRACMDAGLIKGEGFAVDATVIEADASRYHGKAPDEIDTG